MCTCDRSFRSAFSNWILIYEHQNTLRTECGIDLKTVLLLWSKPWGKQHFAVHTNTNFLLVLQALNQWKTLMTYNLDVIVSYYISVSSFPLQFSIDMLSTQEGETRIDKHYNWNVGRVTGLSEKWDISLGDMNKLNLLWILQNWYSVPNSKTVSCHFLFKSCHFKSLGILNFYYS